MKERMNIKITTYPINFLRGDKCAVSSRTRGCLNPKKSRRKAQINQPTQKKIPMAMKAPRKKRDKFRDFFPNNA